MHYVNPTLQESEFDVAMIQVGVKDPLNCQRGINQINNILQNIENIASKCREYCVKQLFIWINNYEHASWIID